MKLEKKERACRVFGHPLINDIHQDEKKEEVGGDREKRLSRAAQTMRTAAIPKLNWALGYPASADLPIHSKPSALSWWTWSKWWWWSLMRKIMTMTDYQPWYADRKHVFARLIRRKKHIDNSDNRSLNISIDPVYALSVEHHDTCDRIEKQNETSSNPASKQRTASSSERFPFYLGPKPFCQISLYTIFITINLIGYHLMSVNVDYGSFSISHDKSPAQYLSTCNSTSLTILFIP